MPELTVNRTDLVRTLKPLEMVSEKKRDLVPILRSMHLTYNDSKLRIETTNNLGWVEFTIPCKGEDEFHVCLPAEQFAKAIRSFDAEEVTIEHSDNWHTLVKCGRSKLQIPGMDPSIFPTRGRDSFPITFFANRSQLLNCLNQVYHARDKQGTGKRGHAVHFTVDAPDANSNCVCHIVTSNTERFAKSELEFRAHAGPNESVVFIIPEEENNKAAWNLIAALREGKEDLIFIETDNRIISFECGDIVYQCRLKESATFDLSRVEAISEEYGGLLCEVKIPRTTFSSVLSRAMKWGGDEENEVNKTYFASKGKTLLVKSIDSDGSYRFSEEIDLDIDKKLPPFFLSVLSEYTLDAVNAIQSPEVLVGFPKSKDDNEGGENPGPFRILPADEEERFVEWFAPMKIDDIKGTKKALEL